MAKLTTGLLNQGNRVCIIENEIGENSIDDLLLKTASVEISTISGGCICCQVSGNLIEALRQMDNDFRPDWVLVELTGAAFADAVIDNLRLYLPGEHKLVVMAITDAARWPVLIRAAKPMILRQLKGAQVVVVNKADASDNLSQTLQQIQELMPESIALPLSALQDSCQQLMEVLIKEAMPL